MPKYRPDVVNRDISCTLVHSQLSALILSISTDQESQLLLNQPQNTRAIAWPCAQCFDVADTLWSQILQSTATKRAWSAWEVRARYTPRCGFKCVNLLTLSTHVRPQAITKADKGDEVSLLAVSRHFYLGTNEPEKSTTALRRRSGRDICQT